MPSATNSAAALALAATFALAACSPAARHPPLILTVPRTDFSHCIPAHGVVSTQRYVSVRAPDTAYTGALIFLHPEGEWIRQGEPIARFDSASLIDRIEISRDDLLAAEEQMEDAKIRWDRVFDSLNAQNQGLRLGLADAELDTEKYRFNAAITRQMYEARLNDARGRVEASKDLSKRYHIQRDSEFRYKQERLDEQRLNQQELEALEEAFTIRAPFDGVVLYPDIFIAGVLKKAEPGDILPRNQEFARLPDFRDKALHLYVPEDAVDAVRPGQQVGFSVLSAPGTRWNATIDQVGRVASEQPLYRGQMHFLVVAHIPPGQPHMDLLIPGGCVEADIIVAEHNGVFPVPVDYLPPDADPPAVTCLGPGGHPTRREVADAPRTGDFVLLPASPDETSLQIVGGP